MHTIQRNNTISTTTDLRYQIPLPPGQCCFLQMSKDQGCFRTHNNIAPKGRGKGGRSIARMLAKMVWECDIFSTVLSKIVACQQQFQRATMVYRSLHGLAPNYLSSKFERREVAYNLRDSENKLNVPLPRTNYYKNSFSYSGAILWNSLPCNQNLRNVMMLKWGDMLRSIFIEKVLPMFSKRLVESCLERP